MTTAKNRYEEQLEALAEGQLEGLEVLAKMHEGNLEASGLDEKTWQLVRIAALATLDAPAVSWNAHLRVADDMGLTAEEIIGTLVAVAPIVGSARIISAAQKISTALGL